MDPSRLFVLWQGGLMAWIYITEYPWSSHIILYDALSIILDVKLSIFSFDILLEDAPIFSFDILLEDARVWMSCCTCPSWSLHVWVPNWGWGKLSPTSNDSWKIFDSLIDPGWSPLPIYGAPITNGSLVNNTPSNEMHTFKMTKTNKVQSSSSFCVVLLGCARLVL